MAGPCIGKMVENCILRKQTVAVCHLSRAGNYHMELSATQPLLKFKLQIMIEDSVTQYEILQKQVAQVSHINACNYAE